MAAPRPDPPPPRLARAGETDAVSALVRRAYAGWVPVLGLRPAPMDDDYAAHIARGEVFVIAGPEGLLAVAVLVLHADHLMVDNLAVDPAAQAQGLGYRLLAFAEETARERGIHELRLFTHVGMHRNVRLYERWGFAVTHRATEGPYDRVFMSKSLEPAPRDAV